MKKEGNSEIDGEDTTKRYRKTLALYDVCMSFGAGKNTNLKNISNRIGPDRGKNTIENKLVKDSSGDFVKICHVREENCFRPRPNT